MHNFVFQMSQVQEGAVRLPARALVGSHYFCQVMTSAFQATCPPLHSLMRTGTYASMGMQGCVLVWSSAPELGPAAAEAAVGRFLRIAAPRALPQQRSAGPRIVR